MNTANIWKEKVRRCSAFLIFLSLWVMAPAAWAAHEVDKGDITADVEISKLTKWTDNLVVRWKAPSMGTDILNGYFYKWNESSSLLNENDGLFADFSVTMDDSVGPDIDPPNAAKDKADLANLDSGNVLYLHIITSYLDVTNATGARVSADTVYGPFLIDNKAPVGTVRIVDGASNDIITTSDTKLNIEFSAAKDPVTMYLSDTGNKPATGTAYSSALVWDLSNTNPGLKTISAWFEDSVGNLSQIATDSVTLLSTITISPNTATLDLAASATQTFIVEGTDAVYTWSIIDETLETGGAATAGTIAQFSGSNTGNSVTVQGLAKGTFKLQADPDTNVAGDELKSGTISVVQSTTSKTYNLITTSTTSVNAIVLSRAGTGYTKASNLYAAVPNCNDLSRWNATDQVYESYVPFANDFDLIVGEPYFVNVSSPGAFTVTGSVPVPSFTLGVTATTSVNAISLPQSKSGLTKGSQLIADIPNANDLSRWNAADQVYESYVPFANDFDIGVDEAYFVNVSSLTTWP